MSDTQVILPIVGVLFGAVLAGVGVTGLRGALRRNRFVGVRTAATLRSDEAFRLANRVAGLPAVIGGCIAVAGALMQFALSSSQARLTVAVLTLLGGFAIVLAGAMLGQRAAQALPEPLSTQVGGGCTGCPCGQSGGCGGLRTE